MAPYRIPFNRPAFVGDEFRFMHEAMDRGKISGDGDFTKRCNAILERELGAARVRFDEAACNHG